MTIQKKDLFHGAALTQIVEHASFKALNKAEDCRYGHYLLNTDVLIWVKYSTGTRKPSYQFTFGPEEVRAIECDMSMHKCVFVVLVCGEEVIACLDEGDVIAKLDLQTKDTQWVKVRAERGKQLRVSGSLAPESTLIPRNRFPNILFNAAR